MEDVIFNGAETRKPVGMAEVNIIFSTEDGKAPPQYEDFSEIQITRRLYRSGESEYLINKKTCRLKDINELFMDTGVGRQAYSIVEQGQISQILNAKPTERRLLIEEAAGITKYRVRKEEALRKMEATRQDLLRVTDIIAEIKRSLNSLNRQAKKAERYKRFREELRQIDLVLAAKDLREADEQADSIRSETERLTGREEGLRLELEGDEVRHNRLRLETLEKEKAINEGQEGLFEVSSEIQKLESSMELIRRDLEDIDTREARYAEEIRQHHEKAEAARKEKEGAGQEAARYRSLIDQEESDLENRSKELAAAQQKYNELRTQIDREKSCLTDYLTKITSLRNEIEANGERGREIASRMSRIDQDRASLQEKAGRLEEDRKELASVLAELQNTKGEIEGRKAEKQESMKALQRDSEPKRARYQEHKENLEGKRVRLKSLVEMKQNLEGFHQGVRNIMKRHNGESRGNGVYGVVADLLETSPKYEAALEAVLGDRLQGVVVKSQQEGVSGVEFLKAGSRGRSSFIPLAELRSARTMDFPETVVRESIAPMRQLVSCSEDYAPMADYLLGDVLLVESLPKAVEIFHANGYTGSLVTLDGEVLDPFGVLTGGSSESVQNGILQKRREIKDLEAEIAALEKEFEQVEKAHFAGLGLISTLEKTIEDLSDRIHSLDLELVNKNSAIERVDAELAQVIERRQALSDAEAEIRDEEAKRVQSFETARDSLAGVERIKEEKARTVSDLESLAEGLRKEIDNLSNQVTEARIGITAYREKRDALAQRILHLDQEYGGLIRNIENREQELSLDRKKRKDLVSRSKEVTGLIEQGHKRYSVKKEGLDGLRDAYNEALAEVKRQEERQREKRNELEELREKINSLKLRISEVDIKRQYLVSGIAEKYRIDIAGCHGEYVLEEDQDPEAMKARQTELRDRIEAMGEVNPNAIEEYEENRVRHEFLTKQKEDLEAAMESLRQAIYRINQTTRHRLTETFEAVDGKFREIIPLLFPGGTGELRLVGEDEDVLNSGVDMVIRPQGKRLQNVQLLSGGEKALSAIALLFALFLQRPSPFCLLDEVDAPLDDLNIDRFNILVEKLAEMSQFIIITHNKHTMEIANTLYGITMEEPGISKQVSVHFE